MNKNIRKPNTYKISTILLSLVTLAFVTTNIVSTILAHHSIDRILTGMGSDALNDDAWNSLGFSALAVLFFGLMLAIDLYIIVRAVQKIRPPVLTITIMILGPICAIALYVIDGVVN